MEPKNYITFELVVHGFLVLFVGTIGIIGNIFCLLVLCRPSMRNSINCLFIGLAAIDILLILSAFVMFSLPAFQVYVEHKFMWNVIDVYQYTTPFVYPIAMITQTASVYMTLTIALERYLVVCLPLKSRSICTYGRAKRCVFTVVVFSFCYNVTRFLEYSFETIVIDEERGITVTFLQSTDLRENLLYISIYINWLYMVFMCLVPFSVLFLVNLRIAWGIRQARMERSRISRTQRNEESLAIMLMVIVFIFIACNTPAMISNTMETFQIQAVKLTQISNLLIVFNSSTSIFIYTAFSRKFRRILLQMCHRKRPEDDVLFRWKAEEGPNLTRNRSTRTISARRARILTATTSLEFQRELSS